MRLPRKTWLTSCSGGSATSVEQLQAAQAVERRGDPVRYDTQAWGWTPLFVHLKRRCRSGIIFECCITVDPKRCCEKGDDPEDHEKRRTPLLLVTAAVAPPPP